MIRIPTLSNLHLIVPKSHWTGSSHHYQELLDLSIPAGLVMKCWVMAVTHLASSRGESGTWEGMCPDHFWRLLILVSGINLTCGDKTGVVIMEKNKK